MRLEAAETRRRRLSMTSLIDVIFLLLLFFMLSSTFSRFGEIELAGATASGASAQSRPVFLQLRGDDIAINGAPATLEDLASRLATQAENGASNVLLSVGETTNSQRFVDVYSSIRAVPGLKVAVIR